MRNIMLYFRKLYENLIFWAIYYLEEILNLFQPSNIK